MTRPTKRPAVELRELTFSYGASGRGPLLTGVTFDIPTHSRTLILGANGVGKSTLLRLIAGKHMLKPGCLNVFGQDPFSSGLHPGDVTLVGERFPLELDISVEELLEGRRRHDPDVDRPASTKLARELIELLGIDLKWRMHAVSGGQRRRVDVLLSLLGSPRLLLLDEVTSDLDLLVRQELLRWLKKRTLAQAMTIVLATHILDGMAEWASHVAFLKPGGLRSFSTLKTAPGWTEALRRRPHAPLLWLAEKRLREDGR